MTFGEKVARLLSEKQRTQRWLARKVNTSPNTISHIVNGGDTSYRTALKVAHALEVNANWLLDDVLDWPPPPQPMLVAPGVQDVGRLMFHRINKLYDLLFPLAADQDSDRETLPDQPQPARSRSRSTPKPRTTGEKPTATTPKKTKPRTTAKKSAPAKPKRPKRPPRS